MPILLAFFLFGVICMVGICFLIFIWEKRDKNNDPPAP